MSKPRHLPLILTDTREQDPLRPYVVRDRQRIDLPTERATLASGDYSLPGLEDSIAIERKNIADLWGTMFGARMDSVGEAQPAQDRFRAELERLRQHPRARIVVEGAPRDLWRYAVERAHGDEDRARKHYGSLWPLLASIDLDYGIPVIWAGSRSLAEWWVGSYLARAWEQHTGGEAARTARTRGTAEHLPWHREAPTEGALEAMARAALIASERPANDGQRRALAPAGGMTGSTTEYQRRKAAAKATR